MAEEMKKNDTLLEEDMHEADMPVDDDADIDNYIRELTGKEAPKKKEPEAPKEPEVEHFRVTSDIGADDYKAFIYFSTLGRYKWVLPTFIIVPIAFSVFFAFNEGKFYSGNLILSLVLMFGLMTFIVLFRCRRWLSKIKKNNEKVMRLTNTTLIFLTYSVVNMKNGNRVKVEYEHLIQACESRKRFILYFDNGKSMLFRKDDMDREQLEAFRPFIQSKVHKLKLFKK